MAFVDQYALALDVTFQKRILVAMETAATQVQTEDVGTANHTNRANYAKLVLANPGAYLLPFCQAVVTNAAITSASLDSDLQFQVNSIWNAMAGTI